MTRPYFQVGADDLETLIEKHRDDAEQLAVILDELEHRSKPKAKALKQRIGKLFAARAARTIAPNVLAASEPQGQEHLDLTQDVSTVVADNEMTVSQNESSGPTEDVDRDPLPKRTTSRIRKQGRLTDVPDARPKFTSNKIDLKLPTGTPLVRGYLKCLELYVADMRRKNSGSRTVTVTNGRRIAVDTGGYGYQFLFDGDESLFEGAAIVADVAGRSL